MSDKELYSGMIRLRILYHASNNAYHRAILVSASS